MPPLMKRPRRRSSSALFIAEECLLNMVNLKVVIGVRQCVCFDACATRFSLILARQTSQDLERESERAREPTTTSRSPPFCLAETETVCAFQRDLTAQFKTSNSTLMKNQSLISRTGEVDIRIPGKSVVLEERCDTV